MKVEAFGSPYDICTYLFRIILFLSWLVEVFCWEEKRDHTRRMSENRSTVTT